MPSIALIAFGKTYVVSPFSDRYYYANGDRTISKGGSFTASQTDAQSDALRLGMARGHITETFDQVLIADRAARRDELLANLATFISGTFGSGASQRRIAEDSINAKFNADNASAISVTTVLDSDEAVTGTVTTTGKYRCLLNGVIDGTVFTVTAGAFSHTFAGEPVAGDIVGIQAMLADGVTTASDPVNVTVGATDVTLSPVLAGDATVTFSVVRAGTYQAQIGGVDSGAPTVVAAAGSGKICTFGAPPVGGDIVGVYETTAPITDPVTTTTKFLAPAITEPVNAADTTVVVTSSPAAANGTAVNVYRLGVSIGSGVVAGGAGACTVTVSALAGTQSLTAKHGAGASLSAASAAAVVHYDAPVITSNNVQGSDQCNGTSTAADGTVVNAYIGGVFKAADVVTGGTFIINGVTPQVGGDSLTAKVGVLASASLSAASTPKIVKFNAPAITDSTYVATTTGTVTGTTDAADGTQIELFDGVASLGTTTAAGGTWSIGAGALTLVGGDSLTATAGTGAALSAASTAVIVHFKAPAISVPVAAADTTVTVTSSPAAADDTVVLVTRGGVDIGTGVVAGGAGACVVTLTASLAGGNLLKAQHGSGASLSAFSSTIEVHFDAPAITAPVVDADTSVSGTSNAADGTAINTFVNGAIQAPPVTVTGGVWTKTGLTLAVGDLVKATAGANGGASESVYSATRTVQFNAAALAAPAAAAHLTGTTVTVPDGTAIVLYKQTLGAGPFNIVTAAAGGTVVGDAIDLTPTVAFAATDVLKVTLGPGDATQSEFSNAVTVTA